MHIKIHVCNNFRLQRIPSLFVIANERTFIINMPELTQRFLKEHGVKMSKATKIIFTGHTSDYFMGLPGYMLTSHEHGMHIDTQIYSSNKIYDILLAFKSLFGLKFMYFSSYGINLHAKDSALPGINNELPSHIVSNFSQLIDFFNDWENKSEQSIEKLSHLLHHAKDSISKKSRYFLQQEIESNKLRIMAEDDYEVIFIPIENESKNSIAFCLLFLFSEKEMKYDKTKIKLYGLTGMQIKALKNGEKIELANGKVIVESDIQQTTIPQGFFVFDVPDSEFLDNFISNRFINNILENKNIFAVNYLFHIAKSDVVLSSKYINFLNQPFVNKFKNVFLSSDFDQEFNSETSFRYRAYFNTLSAKFPRFFPKLPSLKPYSLIPDLPIHNVIYHKSFTSYNLVKEKIETIPFMAENSKLLTYINQMQYDINHKFYQKHNSEIKLPADLDKTPFFIVLGTGSMVPNTFRNVSAIMYAINDNFYALMDCGEGTIFQITEQFGEKSDLVIFKLQLILITHLHGDHFFGLLDLIRYRAKLMKTLKVDNPTKLFVVVPRNCLTMLMMFVEFSKLQNDIIVVTNQELMGYYLSKQEIDYLSNLIAIDEGKGTYASFKYQNPAYVKSVSLYKSIYPESLKDFLEIASKNDIQKVLPVPVFHCPESVGFVIESGGKKIVYSGDCKISRHLIPYAINADILFHESTFDCSENIEKVLGKDHSNIEHALTMGLEMNAKHTCLTHFSQRFRIINDDEDYDVTLPNNPVLIEYFKTKAFLAQDHLHFNFDTVQILPEVHNCINSTYNFKLHQEQPVFAIKKED